MPNSSPNGPETRVQSDGNAAIEHAVVAALQQKMMASS